MSLSWVLVARPIRPFETERLINYQVN